MTSATAQGHESVEARTRTLFAVPCEAAANRQTAPGQRLGKWYMGS